MYKKIFKYKLEVETTNVISMPKGAEVLSVGLQNNEPVVWALVDPVEENMESKVFYMFGTGEGISLEMNANTKFIGTLQPVEGSVSFAFHIFLCI